MQRSTSLFLILLMVLLTGCSAGEQSEESSGPLDDYPNSHLLVSASQLQDDLNSGNTPHLIDAREELKDGVIPGAVHFPAVSSLIDSDHPIEKYLVGPDRFQELMREIGLNNDSRVVIYDEGNALAAARLFYALDYFGFSNASILNGGIQAWKENGVELSDTAVTPDEGVFQVSVQESLMCDFDYVTAASQSDDKIIYDARSLDEYTGEDERAMKSGHIPNAVHLEWSNVIELEGTPYFRPAQQIREIYNEHGIAPDKEVIPHCQSNVRGSHSYFTLRLMGYDSVRPYEGSWADYGNREDATVSQ